MKSFRKLKSVCAILSLALLMSMTACSGGDAAEASEKDYRQAPYYNAFMDWCDRKGFTEEERQIILRQIVLENTVSMDKILYSDEYWTGDSDNDLTCVFCIGIDGGIGVSISTENRYYETRACQFDFCCVVPYGTSLEDRKEGLYQRLDYSSDGLSWGDLEVVEASSYYENASILSSVSETKIVSQRVSFEGSVTLTGTVEYHNPERGYNEIFFTVDEESCEKLPSLKAYIDGRAYEEENFTNEKIYFEITQSDNGQQYDEIAEQLDSLDSGEEIRVTVEVHKFSMSWSDKVSVSDVTSGYFTDFDIISISRA